MKSLLLTLFFVPCALFAQVDTLQNQIKARGESEATVDWLNKAIQPLNRTDPKSLEKYARIALAIAERIHYFDGIADAEYLIGLSFWQRDLHQQAMEHYLRTLQIYQENKNDYKIATTLVSIGSTYDELGQREKGKTYIKNGLDIFTRLGDENKISGAQLNLGVIHFYEEQYDSSLYYFDQVLAYRISQKDTSRIALLYLNLANVYEYQNNIQKANEHYRLARTMADTSQLIICNIYLGLGNGLLLAGAEKEGLIYLDSGLQVAQAKDQSYMRQVAYSSYKEHYIRKGLYKEALDYLEKEYALDKEIRGEEVQSQIEVLNLKYEDEKKEKQLAVLEAEKARKDLYLILSLVLGTFILLIGILIIVLLRLKVKNGKLKEKELKDQLDYKSKELTSYALNFIQKNELLSELNDKVNELKNESSDKSTQGLNQLNRMINGSLRIDQDWENFKMMFEEVHAGFFFRLKDSFPELGNAELKLCALLRLNMNLKESSRILGISSDSVKTARSRLRKKLGLSTEENLVDFLIRFDAKSKYELIA